MSTETKGRFGDVDAVTFEVLRNTFEYACNRMSTIMQRTSFSPILADILDFSNAVYDPELRLLAQAANCPVHLAAMQYSADAAARKYPIETMKPGDIYALNDPYQGGTHTNDITFIMPVFYEEEVLGFAVSRNTRTPFFIEGDLQAHLGALRAAEQELQRAARRYGLTTVKAAMKELIGYTERIIRKSIEEIPDGVYYAEDFADTDGFSPDPVKVAVQLTVKGSNIHVDFNGSDPTCKGSINSPYANTASAAYYSLQFFLAPHAPSNAGMFVPITLDIPEGTWLNPQWPAPTIGCTTLTSSKITSAIWQALAQAIPDRVTGSTCSECNWFVSSTKDEHGNANVFSDLPAGGWGGTPYNDGMSVTMDPLGNCMNMMAETAELLFPIEYEAFELRPDSAGAGKFRGGLGANFKVRFLCEGEMNMETSRTREGSPGVNGGLRSDVQRSKHLYPDGREIVIGGLTENGDWCSPLLSSHPFNYDEVFQFESTGGGGPRERPAQKVLDDVLDGYVSIEKARDAYGVVIDPENMTLDEAETARLRAA